MLACIYKHEGDGFVHEMEEEGRNQHAAVTPTVRDRKRGKRDSVDLSRRPILGASHSESMRNGERDSRGAVLSPFL